MTGDRGLRYLALGDSYTIGEGIAEAGRWPMQLAAALRAEGIALDDPLVVATTGWTTDELMRAIEVARPTGPFALVSLLIGVNNQYRGGDVAVYRREFHSLLLQAIAFADDRADRVLALSIPDWGITPFGVQSGRDRAQVARELDTFNATAQAVCATLDVAFVDIAPVSRARGGEIVMLAEDGLHPSAAMYAEWTACALPVARALLGRTPPETE